MVFKKSYLNNNLIKSRCLLYVRHPLWGHFRVYIVGSRQGLYCGVTSGFILWGQGSRQGLYFQTTNQQWPNWNFWYQNQVHTETCFPIGQLDNLSNCLAYHWTIKDESHWMTGYLMWPKIEGYQMLVYHQKKIQQTFLFWLEHKPCYIKHKKYMLYIQL